MVKLEGYRVSDLKFRNQVDRDGNITLKFSYSYKVVYSENIEDCIGICGLLLTCEESEKFSFEIEVQGKFRVSDETNKTKIHRESFSQIYPVAKSIVNMVTANIALPPINLPDIPYDKIPVNEDEIEE